MLIDDGIMVFSTKPIADDRIKKMIKPAINMVGMINLRKNFI